MKIERLLGIVVYLLNRDFVNAKLGWNTHYIYERYKWWIWYSR